MGRPFGTSRAALLFAGGLSLSVAATCGSDEATVTELPDVLAAVHGPAISPASGTSDITSDEIAEILAARHLVIPVAGVARTSLRDTFLERRGAGPHEAIDIGAPRGTAVIAADSGRVVKLFTSVAGGLTVYQFDRDEKFAYYYAHLDGYAEGLREGMFLKQGDVVGYVGTSGNAPANAPHLHFAIFLLGSEKRWWKGSAIDPYPFLNESER